MVMALELLGFLCRIVLSSICACSMFFLFEFLYLVGRMYKRKYTVNQRLLVSANTEYLCDVFFHVCKHSSPRDITMSWCHNDIKCHSIWFTVRNLSISKNRSCRSHRCPTDTNKINLLAFGSILDLFIREFLDKFNCRIHSSTENFFCFLKCKLFPSVHLYKAG